MRVLHKYRLELRWESVDYTRPEVAVLKGAYFAGPVLKDSEQLREEDELTLDMTKQHMVFSPMQDFYQAVLHWKGVQYQGNKIFLKEAHIKGKYVNSLETLENTDWILIDCKGHDDSNHPFNLVYWSEIHKFDNSEKYSGK